ncbi:DegT/DnrJ/EryC1/StrS family aminotransferase [Acinetobacter sp. ANC 5378]|uniref:DegT/DnrJ/EryC1/StrS family aminotransferase n=1 Tax=Acinetobacter sp. ANC 5378 TaxID=2731249 RepID=UPI001490308C|nr:DegT/DnrJ/EryC1/StrS family aminotransferase [Acinetobacter sp. ANC 5378]NNG81653.1 DegT/DnrJ/EryC1/StrS aminotransferase family protein [Acinetobacter sp. ANC 5378]
MMLDNGFVINAPKHLLPSYRISPFRTIDIYKNRSIQGGGEIGIEKYLSNRFECRKILLTDSGRSALDASLVALGLKADDVVTIFTTTNKFYISGCVTDQIEKYCKWSRKIEKNTKAILVNHEFGYCSQEMKSYASLGYPIIEDFAHSFASDSINNDAGYYGDFLIFSFSKYFPIQIGGALVYSNKFNIKNKEGSGFESYVRNTVSDCIDLIPSIKLKKLENYKYYSEQFLKLNLKSYFKLEKNDCPGVFCFKINNDIDLNKMKNFINSQGIESSIFYGEKAYFLPCHQNMNKQDIDYIYTVVKYFLEVNL